jgi:hypothetical protein
MRRNREITVLEAKIMIDDVAAAEPEVACAVVKVGGRNGSVGERSEGALHDLRIYWPPAFLFTHIHIRVATSGVLISFICARGHDA